MYLHSITQTEEYSSQDRVDSFIDVIIARCINCLSRKGKGKPMILYLTWWAFKFHKHTNE